MIDHGPVIKSAGVRIIRWGKKNKRGLKKIIKNTKKAYSDDSGFQMVIKIF